MNLRIHPFHNFKHTVGGGAEGTQQEEDGGDREGNPTIILGTQKGAAGGDQH